MMVYRSGGDRGTLMIDLMFKGIGRVQRASGTNDPTFLADLKAMLRTLAKGPRRDLIAAVRDGHLTPLQVWEFHRTGKILEAPSAAELAPLKEALERWHKGYDCSKEHRAGLHRAIVRLLKVTPKGAVIHDLPALLRDLREADLEAGKRRAFNLTRDMARAFARTIFNVRHPLYFAVCDVPPLKMTAEPILAKPWPVIEALATTMKSGGEMVLSLASSGMRRAEYWSERWRIEGILIRLRGVKGEKMRVMPLLIPPVTPFLQPAWLLHRMEEASGETITIHALRHAYAHLLEEAEIPRTRRKIYMGHGRKFEELYTWHEVTEYIREDRAKLLAKMGRAAPRLQLERGA